MNKIIITLLAITLMFGCSRPQRSVSSLTERMRKNLASIETISSSNRDSIYCYLDTVTVALRESVEQERIMFERIVKLESQYGVSRDSIETVIYEEFQLLQQSSRRVIESRVAMRRFMTVAEWNRFVGR